MHGHSPVGDIGVIERRLERFVLYKQPLFRVETIVSFFKCLFEPLLALADICCAWITRAVGKPHGYITAVELMGYLNAVNRVLKRVLPNFRVGISKRTVFINLVLKQIGIN